jgi:hypothetical protein
MTDNLATVRENEIDRALGALSDMAGINAAYVIHCLCQTTNDLP